MKNIGVKSFVLLTPVLSKLDNLQLLIGAILASPPSVRLFAIASQQGHPLSLVS